MSESVKGDAKFNGTASQSPVGASPPRIWSRIRDASGPERERVGKRHAAERRAPVQLQQICEAVVATPRRSGLALQYGVPRSLRSSTRSPRNASRGAHAAREKVRLVVGVDGQPPVHPPGAGCGSEDGWVRCRGCAHARSSPRLPRNRPPVGAKSMPPLFSWMGSPRARRLRDRRHAQARVAVRAHERAPASNGWYSSVETFCSLPICVEGHSPPS